MLVERIEVLPSPPVAAPVPVRSTGANETAGRHTAGHFDRPMRNCTVMLDGEAVVEGGRLAGDFA